MSNRLPKQVEWVRDARWASWWLSDEELFNFKQRDFEKKARQLRASGVNAVITFGAFHFRWNFVDEWPEMLCMLRRLCAACHRHAIKVVEHHSALGVFHPVGEKERQNILAYIKKNPEKHSGFLKILNDGDKEYKGLKFSSMRQIDPRTSQFARSGYLAYPFCHNNPDWQRLYFAHLKAIYACGVDGIMTDDVQFWLKDYACGCIHCRDKFKQDTGYEMPPSGIDDKNFYGNIDNPANRAWVLWRIRCHQEHQKRVFDHFRSLGLELARPIYCSCNTNSYGSRGMGLALDNLDGCYSTIFTEVNSTEPQAHCWLRIGAESSQRSALARRNGAPPMCLFYPHNAEENLFCWAMTKTWGQNYWGTNWGMKLKKEAAMLARPFNFEKKHSRLNARPESVAEVGVLFSARTVWLHGDQDAKPDYIRMSDPASTDCWAGWCEVLALANIPFDTFGDNDLEERRYFDRFRLIIVPNAVCLSDKAVTALKAFARQGGKLIITHQSGLKDETGAWRKKYPFSDLVGADASGKALAQTEYRGIRQKSPPWITTKQNQLAVAKCDCPQAPVAVFSLRKNAKELMTLAGGKGPALFRHRYGKGSVIVFAGKPGRIVCINRHKRIEKRTGKNDTDLDRGLGRRFAEIDFTMNSRVKRLMQAAVKSLAPDAPFETEGVPEGFIAGVWTCGAHTVIHITNAAGTLLDSGKTVPIPAPLRFPRADTLPGGSRTMLLKIRRDCRQAILRSPELIGAKKLVVRKSGAATVIEVPAGLVRCYSVIEAD
ncbi:MAG: beta-galactosidase trimerization domain-containing protein [Kiritimatiellae bacterium]|nr:beta-galactosidase trimerization domain-containing protein [Kiritimatiellia bacterium]